MRTLCRVLGVSPSGYYAWSRRGPSARSVTDAALTGQIRRAHARGRGTYGAPRVHAELREAGVHVGRKRIARLMHADGLAGISRRRFVRTTVRDRDAAPAPDLVERQFGGTPPTGCGSRTSRTCPRGPASATSRRSPTPAPAGSWAGAWPPTCGPSSSPRRWTWPSLAAGHRRAWSITRTGAPSTRASPSAAGSGRPGSRRRWDRAATATTVRLSSPLGRPDPSLRLTVRCPGC